MLPHFETGFKSFCLQKAKQEEKNSFNLGGRFVKIEKQVSTARYEYFRKYDQTINDMKPFFKYRTSSGFKKGGFLLYGIPKSGKTALIMKMCSLHPKLTVFSLRIKDFIHGDAEEFFEIAKNYDPAVVVIEDLDEVISPEGRARHLKEELFFEIFKVHNVPWYKRKRVMVAAETRYPFLLRDVQLDQIFRDRFFVPIVGVKLREEWPKPEEWRDEIYVDNLKAFRDDSEFLIEQRMEAELKRSSFKKFLSRAFCIGE